MMNNVFRDYLDDFVACYINGIFIFLKTMEDHDHHVHLVLEKLQKVGLYTKLEKCEFHQFGVELLGYVVFGNDIHMDLRKVQTTVDWVILTFV
jgi:hypothetical protein